MGARVKNVFPRDGLLNAHHISKLVYKKRAKTSALKGRLYANKKKVPRLSACLATVRIRALVKFVVFRSELGTVLSARRGRNVNGPTW
jgi:hypothetical protein